MQPTFWKLSQGEKEFTYEDILDSIESKLVYIHKNTPAKGRSKDTQASNFINANIGDYFYLTHGNTGVYMLGQFSGAANLFSKYGEGWIDRPFRFIKASAKKGKYSGSKKWWTPNENSTFIEVPHSEIKQFEKEILSPFFEIILEDFGVKA